jgi:hypothetical protein
VFRYFEAGLIVAIAGCHPGPDCVGEGDWYDLKLGKEGPCCDGLNAVNTTAAPDADGNCEIVDLNPAKVCIACGDDVCAPDENVCNCPADCPR